MDKKQFNDLLKNQALILDGATGTELQKRGYLKDIGAPEELNIKYPERIKEIHLDYLKAGSNIILANTFGANRAKLADYNLTDKIEILNHSAIKNAREAADKYKAFVAADIGPIGSYLTPLGPTSFDTAYDIFSEQIKFLSSAKPDLIFIETMAEIREVKAALLAVKDNFNGPVVVQMTFGADGATVTGTDVLTFLSVAESMGADAIGLNCSVGPKDLLKLAKILAENTHLPISFKPNAGMPKLVNRETVFPGTAKEFVEMSVEAFNSGVNMLGGCCGTTPEFISGLSKALKGKKPASRKSNNKFLLSSRVKSVNLANIKKFISVGERINPTNRNKFQSELINNNFATLRREAQEQVKSGADILDINMGVPGANEVELLSRAVEEIQEVVSVPLCLDSSNPAALEAGLKACAGKPIINSVDGNQEKLETVLPLAKRYGAAVVGLTTDNTGLPKTVEKRIEIAGKIIAHAKKIGFNESEIIFDFLTLSVSAMPDQTKETLATIKKSKQLWPNIKTILGVSNISFGMPNRQIINSTFLNLAKSAGLDMGILNPHENWGINDSYASDLLLNNDPDGKNYIQKHGVVIKKPSIDKLKTMPADKKLYLAVLEGNREEIKDLINETLKLNIKPLEISNMILLKALNEVGDKFNKKEYFLPQVIRAAEAAQAAFAEIKPLLKQDTSFKPGKMVIATVKGDVHDIGKNIVSAVFESHGWEVVDLGKNVDAETIVKEAQKKSSPLIGLSALMTTTMLEMEKVIQYNKTVKNHSKIIVGGAPVTDKFAREIGADAYAKNAVEAVEVARILIGL